MPEAVIVATARTPIGRAFKGSLRHLRPDDMAATAIRTALDKVPDLDPADIDDLYLGCGLPGGEAGFNMGRVVAVMLGYDRLPAATLTRYCASSLQTTRMALHAIRSGEGDVFISAGVEAVSRYARGNSDVLPDAAQELVGGGWQNPVFDTARQRSRQRAETGADTWTDPRDEAELPDVYLARGQTAENLAAQRGISRAEMDEFGVRSQNLAEAAINDGFWAEEITPITLP
ncbi:MAG: acetyl-CoA C-acyltransferase, partial [Stackebrandtia sp.]